jgi:hypothetical protein
MAAPKKGQLAQFQVVLVDSVDFASVESGITASDFNSGATVKFYGTNHGGSAATTSGTVSKTASLIRSGMFRLTLKGTENNYDNMSLRINKTGCAEQILQWGNVDNDDSDLMSALTVIQSMASDAASAAVQTNSRVLLNQSRISDIASYLVAMSDVLSNAYSAAAQGSSRTLLVQSNVSDVQSYLVAMSGVQSDILSALVALSDAMSDAHSDLASKIGGITASVSASDISDIASAVRAAIVSDLSDIYSLLSDLNSNILSRIPEEPASRSQLDQFNSDFASFIDARYTSTISRLSDVGSDLRSYLVGMSGMLSDVQSALSDAHSDLGSKIGAITVTIGASDISDIASAVVAGLPVVSQISDIYSLLSDLNSQFLSRVPKEPAARSQLSDIGSDLLSYLVGLSDIASNAYSAAAQGSSRTLLTQSLASDVYSLLSDLQSDFQSRVPKAVATNSQLSDLSSDLRSYLTGVSGTLSDVYSLLSDLHSDLGVMSDVQSNVLSVLAAGVEIGASSMSDLRSSIVANGMQAAGADPTGVVGVTDSYGAKLDWLTAMSRNEKTQTSTSAVLKNDGGTAIASATLSDDGTTFTQGEWH